MASKENLAIENPDDEFSLEEGMSNSKFANTKLVLGSMWGALALSILCMIALQFGFFRREFTELTNMLAVIWGGYFFLLFLVLTGLNKKLPDPTLATPIILWSTATILWCSYYLDQLRLAVMMLYLGVMLMGAFRYKLREFMFSATLAVVGYLFILFLLLSTSPELIDLTTELIQWAAFSLLIVGYVLMSGEIAHMRDQVTESNEALNETYEKINELAITDELTGMHNRRYAMQVLQQQKGMADREAYAFSVCFFDLDHFKSVNDNYGHQAGDLVLKKFSELAKSTAGEIDYCSRFGGEEFVLILVKKDIDAAFALADQLRKKIEQSNFDFVEKNLKITVSVGVAEYEVNETVEECLARADEALYQAKETGRNQVLRA